MPVGDSITEGGTNFFSYRYPLWEKLTAAGYSIKYVGARSSPSPVGPLRHEGFSGMNAEFLAAHVDRDFQKYPADIVLLHAGHNHFAREHPVPGIVSATENMIRSFRQTNPKVIILLAEVIHSGKLPKYSYIPELDEALARLAARLNTPSQPVILVNQALKFDWITDTIADHVHPNRRGAEIMAECWFESLTNVLSSAQLKNQPPVNRR